MLLRLKTLMLK